MPFGTLAVEAVEMQVIRQFRELRVWQREMSIVNRVSASFPKREISLPDRQLYTLRDARRNSL